MKHSGPGPEQTLSFDLDDGTGLRVARARFQSETKFSWSIFDGYDRIRILTYSAGTSAIVRLLDEHSFSDFECVFGCENILHTLRDVLAFQQVAIGDARAAIRNLPSERHASILRRVRKGQARFRVLRKQIAHAKLYLLDNTESGSTRVLIGSANLSETAFGGRQSETLVCFDDDEAAWGHYVGMYQSIRDQASDEMPLPPERIEHAEISLTEVPVLALDDHATLVIDSGDEEGPNGNAVHMSVPHQIERIERMKAAVPPVVANLIPAPRNGRQQIPRDIRRRIVKEYSRIRVVQTEEEADHRELSIDRDAKTVTFFREPFSLEADLDSARNDAKLLVEFFGNYEGTFEGGMGVERLQRDYFILWSWLYFSPFMCDMRTLAGHEGDIFRYPSVAIVYGKPSCGKSSLIETLMTSMFGRAYNVDKREFTKRRLWDIQHAYRRFPAVFDDIGRPAIRNHGEDVIKDEVPPLVSEYPCFVLSMNQELKAFTDQIVKRSLMIYTTTALPSYKESLRHELHLKIQEVRRGLSSNLYREYLRRTLARLDVTPVPDDWLEFSSTILSGLVADLLAESPPKWCVPIRWNDYAEKRHERVKAQVDHLLRRATRMKKEGNQSSGWILEKDKVIVIEQTDTFGRREFDWENVPSTLIDDNASVGARTVLNRPELEEFLGRNLNRRRNGMVGRLLGRR
ncbi:MAG: phospholipase D family protein [Chloroflexi bacterium]|nr:phospholipase D family protein [Chloroflexota bacterium]